MIKALYRRYRVRRYNRRLRRAINTLFRVYNDIDVWNRAKIEDAIIVILKNKEA